MTASTDRRGEQKRYGKPMCAACWMKLVDAQDKPAAEGEVE
jgi:non-ribosomal peptide synthetase component E (peptide arylation enzyme)